jgi:fatty acid desaturase
MTSESWHTDDLYDEIDREAEAYFRQRRGWTLRRVLLLILVLFLIVALLVYWLLPALEFWLMPAPTLPLQPALTI